MNSATKSYRRIFSTIILIGTLLSLSGCWSSHELTDRYLVLGVAIDKQDNMINLALQAIRPEQATSTGSSDSQTTSAKSTSFFLLGGSGLTIDEARADLSRRAPRIVYGGHVLAIFVSEELAREGLFPYLDYFARNNLSQAATWVVIAEGSAQDMLAVDNILAQTSAMSLIDLVKTKELIIPSLHQFLLGYHQDAKSQVLASARIVPDSVIRADYRMDELLVRQNALVRDGKLVGFLNEQDTETYDWLKNGFRNSVVAIADSLCPGQTNSIRLKGRPGKFTVRKEGDSLVLELKVTAEFSLSEQSCPERLSSQEQITKFEASVNEALSQRIFTLVQATQRAQVDVFGFADSLHAHQPEVWEDYQDDWPTAYSRAEVSVTVKTRLRDTMMLLGNPGELDLPD